MEGRAEAAPPSTFSQVLFTGIPHSYPPASPITCCYSLHAAFTPNRRDWVGIFKVGWSTTKDYHTFVWVEPCVDVEGQQSLSHQAVFKEYYLPKDESEYYQFCYVDTSGQVRGASTPFCFRNPVEQSVEGSTDDDLLVITTQEQVEQSVREKTELQKELDQTRAEKETLKILLQDQQQAAATTKEQNEQRARELSRLMKELDQTEELNTNLNSTVQQLQGEIDRLKTEMETQRKRSQSLNSDGASKTMEEKYERAVLKINLQKAERDELKATVDAQSEEIAKLNAKLREAERELLKTRDSIELLQVDLQSSEKEKERLSAELQRSAGLTLSIDAVRRENQELCRRLSEQETPQQSSPDHELKVQCQDLDRKLQEALEQLAVERDQSRNAQRQAEYLEREFQQLNRQLEKVVHSYEQEREKSGKYELQHRETMMMMTDKDIAIEEQDNLITLLRQEKDELARDNQCLKGEILGLRRVYGNIQAASNDDSLYMHPNPAPPADDTSAPRNQQEPRQQDEHVYDTIASLQQEEEEEEEGSLVCRHCEERFPGITQHELDQHEQSHRVCPFCTMICDNMEQAVFEDHVYSHEV